MDWEIISFEGMGPIRFGMNPERVAAILGAPQSVRIDGDKRREFRDDDVPIVSFVDDAVSEIEAFHDVENVTFRGADVFSKSGRRVWHLWKPRTVEHWKMSARFCSKTSAYQQGGWISRSKKIIQQPRSPRVRGTNF